MVAVLFTNAKVMDFPGIVVTKTRTVVVPDVCWTGLQHFPIFRRVADRIEILPMASRLSEQNQEAVLVGSLFATIEQNALN